MMMLNSDPTLPQNQGHVPEGVKAPEGLEAGKPTPLEVVPSSPNIDARQPDERSIIVKPDFSLAEASLPPVPEYQRIWQAQQKLSDYLTKTPGLPESHFPSIAYKDGRFYLKVRFLANPKDVSLLPTDFDGFRVDYGPKINGRLAKQAKINNPADPKKDSGGGK